MARNDDDDGDDFYRSFAWPVVKYIAIGIVALLALGVVFGTVFTIPAGHRGVLTTFGDVTTTLEPGLHFKIPFVQAVTKFSVQTLKYEADASAASKDLQDVSTKVALNFHLRPDSVMTVYRDLGVEYADRVIVPAVQESVKANTALFTAEELITKRPLVKEKIDASLTERLAQYGIVVETTSITDFSFSQVFSDSIENKVKAQQDALKAENDLRRIEIEAQQKIATARAEAEGLRLVNEQLKQSQYAMQLEWIRRWDGKLPLYVAGDDGGIMMTMPVEATR